MGMKSILENPAHPLQPMQQNVGYFVLTLGAILVANLVSARIFGTKHDIGLLCRSCVNKGYMKDDYVRFFVRRTTRRAPIINRGRDCLRVFSLVWCYEISSTWEIWTFSFPNYCKGYYARWSVLRKLLRQFLNAGKDSNDQKPKQILSLGAGFDTTFFQLQVSLLVTLLPQIINFNWFLCNWLIPFLFLCCFFFCRMKGLLQTFT